MKKRIFSILIISVLALCCVSCTGRHAQNAGYRLYRSSPVGVEIEYPDFWEVVDNKGEKTVAFAPPLEGYSDTYRDNVTIVSYPLGDGELAFDNYVRKYIESLPSSISGYNFLSEDEKPLENYESHSIVYEGNTDEGPLRISHNFIKSGKCVYVVTLIAEPKSFDYFNNNLKVMLTTFNALLK